MESRPMATKILSNSGASVQRCGGLGVKHNDATEEQETVPEKELASQPGVGRDDGGFDANAGAPAASGGS